MTPPKPDVSTNTIDVATFAPGRVLRWGLYEIVRSYAYWSFVVWGAMILYFRVTEGPQISSDEWMLLFLCSTLFLCLLTAFTYVRSSFCKNCYFRAGPQGISLNLPQYRLFIYRLKPQQLSWNEIGEITQSTFIFNRITVYNLLYIDGLKKQRVFVHRLRILPQFLFRERIPDIIEQLERIREKSPHKPEPII